KTSTFVAVSELDTLKKAIISACRVEAALNEKNIEAKVNRKMIRDRRSIVNLKRILLAITVEKSVSFPEIEQALYRGNKRVIQGKPESRWENQLRSHENLGSQPGINEEVIPYEIEEVTPTKKPRRKCEPSMMDKLHLYNVAENIINALANVTIGQILHYANQRGHLARDIMRPLPPVQEATHIRFEDERKTL
ncbi:24109_t:CDS:2, partial [Gigaspora rosea]